MKKIKILSIILTICIIYILFFFYISSQINISTENKISKLEENYEQYISYEIISYDEEQDIANILIEFYDNAYGISKIEYPNSEQILNCNNKKKVKIDYQINSIHEYKFVMLSSNNQQIEKNIKLDLILPMQPIINFDLQNETVSIEFEESDEITNLYSIDNGITWNEYSGEFSIKDLMLVNVIAKSKKSNGINYSITETLNPKCEYLFHKGQLSSNIPITWEIWWRQRNRIIDINDSNINTYAVGSGGYDFGYFGTNDSIDMTDYNTIVLLGSINGGAQYISNIKYNYDTKWSIESFKANVVKNATAVSSNRYEIDISDITGLNYIGFSFGKTESMNLTGVYLFK